MSLAVECPGCQRTLSLRDGSEGKRARCPDCSTVFMAPSADAFEPSAQPWDLNGATDPSPPAPTPPVAMPSIAVDTDLPRPSSGGPSRRSSMVVTVADFDMPFGSMVRFMVKWSIAAIPAAIILGVILAITLSIVGGIVAGVMHPAGR